MLYLFLLKESMHVYMYLHGMKRKSKFTEIGNRFIVSRIAMSKHGESSSSNDIFILVDTADFNSPVKNK